MQTSILQLVSAGKNLPSAAEVVSYPVDGSDRLQAAEEKHFWFVERRKVIYKLLRAFLPQQNPTNSIAGVDIGCGTGFNAVWLTEHGLPTVGVDAYSGFTGFQAQKKGAGFIQGDIFSIEPKAEFDFVTLLDVIEHTDNDAAFITQAARMLKPGGVMLITVPAFQGLWTKVDDLAGHKRRYTKQDILRFEQVAPLKVSYQSYFFASTLPLYFLNRLASVKKDDVLAEDLSISAIPNFILGKVMAFEGLFLPHISLPFGSSLFAVLKAPYDQREGAAP